MITPENPRIIKSLRIREGLQCEDIAKEMGLGYAQYYQLESGIRRIEPDQMVYLINRLHMSWKDFNECFFDGKLSPFND